MGGCAYNLSARRAWCGTVMALCAVTAVGTTALGPQPQTPGALPPATASIAGRLLNATTGQPIIGGVVVLRELASRDQRVVMTGDTGKFVLVGLPAATYTLHASALGYVGRQYGQHHTLWDGIPIELQTAEVRSRVDVALTPGGAITGRVTTESG